MLSVCLYLAMAGNGKRAGATSCEIAAAVLEASIPTPGGAPLSCSQCEFKLDPHHFSRTQQSKAKRRCIECLRPGSGPTRPQKRPAVSPGNSAMLTQLPAALFESICDMLYDYDPAGGRASSNYRAEKDASSNADPQLINERAAGLWVAELFACTSHEAARMVGDWADGVVSKRKIFIEQDAGMAMARAMLRQSSGAGDGDGDSDSDSDNDGSCMFVEQKRGLGTLRAYDDLIRESADAIQLQTGSKAALERFVQMVLDEDHPDARSLGGEKFEPSRVTAENIAAAAFLHVDRDDRLQPRRQETETHHLRLFCPLVSSRYNRIEWELDLKPNKPCSLEKDRVHAIDCSGQHKWYREQLHNIDDKISLGSFTMDGTFRGEGSGLLVNLCFEPVIRPEEGRAVWEVVAHADASVYGAFVQKQFGGFRRVGEMVNDADCFFMVDKELLQGLLESPSARLRDGVRCADNAKKRLCRGIHRC